jgi:hypothetical protein
MMPTIILPQQRQRLARRRSSIWMRPTPAAAATVEGCNPSERLALRRRVVEFLRHRRGDADPRGALPVARRAASRVGAARPRIYIVSSPP